MHNGDAKITVSYLEEDCIVCWSLVTIFMLFPWEFHYRSVNKYMHAHSHTLTHISGIPWSWGSETKTIAVHPPATFTRTEVSHCFLWKCISQKLNVPIISSFSKWFWVHGIINTEMELVPLQRISGTPYTASYNAAIDCAMGPLPFLRNHMNQNGEGGTVKNAGDSMLTKQPLALTN